MLANEMRDAFVLQYEKINSNDAPGLEDNEISLFLTKFQTQLSYKLIRRSMNPVKEGLDETELRKQGLANLITDSEDTASSGTSLLSVSPANHQNGRFWQMPNDFWFSIEETAWTDQADCSTTDGDPLVAEIEVKAHNELRQNIRNPYQKPGIKGGDRCKIWRVEYQRSSTGRDMINATTQDITSPLHELITDGNFSINRYKVRYIRYPKDIVIDRTTPANQKNSELNPMLHEALVEGAVKLAVISLRDQMAQDPENMTNLQ